MTEQYVDKKGLKQYVPLSEVSIWRLERDGKFPKRRQISKRRVAWLLSEVMEWAKTQQQA
ncbi:MAG: AlpA family phage regulatory protein [Deltaproteobacteria bacterium]|nr:AlpA family phage regulatory protein [Deltaproteobacteria bacterium]TLN01431.1 MAG: AlpA family phage regulatory protein [bacterium]